MGYLCRNPALRFDQYFVLRRERCFFLIFLRLISLARDKKISKEYFHTDLNALSMASLNLSPAIFDPCGTEHPKIGF